MKTYAELIRQNVDSDNSEMYNILRKCIEREYNVKVLEYKPKINYNCTALINGTQQQIRTMIKPTVTGDVIEITSLYYNDVMIDITIPYTDKTKMIHDRIRLGEYLLDRCEMYVTHPSIFE